MLSTAERASVGTVFIYATHPIITWRRRRRWRGELCNASDVCIAGCSTRPAECGHPTTLLSQRDEPESAMFPRGAFPLSAMPAEGTTAASGRNSVRLCRESARSRWRKLRRLAPLGQPTCRTLSTSGCGEIASAESRASFAARGRLTCRAPRDGPVLPARASAPPAVCGSTGRSASAIPELLAC